MGVLKPLGEEMRMSESISSANGVAIKFLLFTCIRHSLVLGKKEIKKGLRSGLTLLSHLIQKLCMNKTWWEINKSTCRLLSVTCSAFISPSLPVIYLSVCGRIESLLYSRPLMPRGDSPCQAAASNEKLKEHINSSI